MTPDDLERIIHRRTSGMTIDRERPVERTVIERIVSAAQAAPNHRKTRPLRVAVLQGDSRLAFGAAVATVMEANSTAPVLLRKCIGPRDCTNRSSRINVPAR